jgi:hypothetical protein
LIVYKSSKIEEASCTKIATLKAATAVQIRSGLRELQQVRGPVADHGSRALIIRPSLVREFWRHLAAAAGVGGLPPPQGGLARRSRPGSQRGRCRVGLVIEDGHWADSATLDLLMFLSGAGGPGGWAGRRVGVVVTCGRGAGRYSRGELWAPPGYLIMFPQVRRMIRELLTTM